MRSGLLKCLSDSGRMRHLRPVEARLGFEWVNVFNRSGVTDSGLSWLHRQCKFTFTPFSRALVTRPSACVPLSPQTSCSRRRLRKPLLIFGSLRVMLTLRCRSSVCGLTLECRKTSGEFIELVYRMTLPCVPKAPVRFR